MNAKSAGEDASCGCALAWAAVYVGGALVTGAAMQDFLDLSVLEAVAYGLLWPMALLHMAAEFITKTYI